MSDSTFIFLVVTWFLVGFISLVASWILDLRGKPYDPDYFKGEGTFFACFLMIVMGYFTLLIVFFFYLPEKLNFRFSFTEFIYKLANTGISKKNKQLERGVWQYDIED